MAKGFAYLVAILDLYSRKVLAFRVSNTPLPPISESRLWKKLCAATAPLRSSTPTRAANSPTGTSRFWKPRAFASARTARGAGYEWYAGI
jgi:hypothetical protein